MVGQPQSELVKRSMLRQSLGVINLLAKITSGFKRFSQIKMRVGACRDPLGLDTGTGVVFLLLNF